MMADQKNDNRLSITDKFKLAAIAVLSVGTIGYMAVTSPQVLEAILGCTLFFVGVSCGLGYFLCPRFKRQVNDAALGLRARLSVRSVLGYNRL